MKPSSTTGPVELTVAGLADGESLLPLVRDYHRFDHIQMTDEQRREAIAPLLEADATAGRIWLIRSAGRLVGYVAICFGYSIEFRGRDAFIDELFIIESARGLGLGTSVLKQVKSLAADLGAVALHLEVAYDNAGARRLYQRLGFESRERFHLMSCPLPHRT